MQQIDATAIDAIGIPRLLLMEHAGLAVARSVRAMTPDPKAVILVCCGMGFNGGDGFSAARHLHDWGYSLSLVLVGRQDRLREEPATYAAILRRLGLRIVEWADRNDLKTQGQCERRLARCHLIVDALLGIGVRDAVREPAASLIKRMNHSSKPIVAVDVPSGLDADTGRVQGIAVKASVTVTFGLPKRGCFIREGPAHVGRLTVDSITIPRELLRTRGG